MQRNEPKGGREAAKAGADAPGPSGEPPDGFLPSGGVMLARVVTLRFDPRLEAFDRFVAQVRRGVAYKKAGRQRQPETMYLLGTPAAAEPLVSGASRTASTGCATWSCERTAAAAARARCRVCWQPLRTSRSRPCDC